MKTLRAEDVFVCVGCGFPRYYLTRPCPTCKRFERAKWIRATRGQ